MKPTVVRVALPHPKQNPVLCWDWVGRVAGYSASFTQPNDATQNEAIARAELSLAGI